MKNFGVVIGFLGFLAVFNVHAAGKAPQHDVARPILVGDSLDLSGSYLGRTSQGEEVHFLVKPIAGRQGSFLGVLVQLDPRVVIYRIDPIAPSTFAMNPVQVTEDGEVGVINDDPSLVLNVGLPQAGSQQPMMTMTSANSSNQSGFKAPVTFDPFMYSQVTWEDYTPGHYLMEGGEDQLSLSPLVQFQANLSSLARGNMVIREKLAGIFTLYRTKVTKTGVRLEAFPGRLGIFLRIPTLFGAKLALLWVSSRDDKDVTKFFLDR